MTSDEEKGARLAYAHALAKETVMLYRIVKSEDPVIETEVGSEALLQMCDACIGIANKEVRIDRRYAPSPPPPANAEQKGEKTAPGVPASIPPAQTPKATAPESKAQTQGSNQPPGGMKTPTQPQTAPNQAEGLPAGYPDTLPCPNCGKRLRGKPSKYPNTPPYYRCATCKVYAKIPKQG